MDFNAFSARHKCVWYGCDITAYVTLGKFYVFHMVTVSGCVEYEMPDARFVAQKKATSSLANM